MEPTWLTYAKRLQAIASTGLHFTKDGYDRERYEEIAGISREMLASLGNVPLERIDGLVSDFARGYATPRVDVRGAIVEGDRILLVREKSDGLWALPGGFADVGLSAAHNVRKEIREEAGLEVSVRRLYGLRHKAGGGYPPDVRDFYKLFFLCDRNSDQAAFAGLETSAAMFFNRQELPPLSHARTLASDIDAAFLFAADADRPVQFD